MTDHESIMNEYSLRASKYNKMQEYYVTNDTSHILDKYDILLYELYHDYSNYDRVYDILLQELITKNIDQQRVYDVMLQVLDAPKPVVIKPTPPPPVYNIVYLFHYNINKYSNVYKIGMTNNYVLKRLKSYPGHTTMIHYVDLKYIPCRTMEKIILYIFRSCQCFTSRLDIGNEYFEGNGDDFITKFKTLIDLCDIPELKDYITKIPIHPNDVRKFARKDMSFYDNIMNTI